MHLERALKPIGREPHSVFGSTCIGASVVGGICNNSEGTLIRRGPATVSVTSRFHSLRIVTRRPMSEIAFHEKAGRSQVDSFLFS
jgi:FAD/FMN-containing dehydrogenase